MLNKETLDFFEKSLKSSPAYHLSLSSKELFHSNFLGWLTDAYPSEMSSVWLSFLQETQGWGQITRALRESRNRDLTLEFSSRKKLVVEIKVKSSPDTSQLERYIIDDPDSELALLSFFDIEGRAGDEVTTFKPCKGSRKDCTWIPWAQLIEKIRNAICEILDSYHKALVNDYCNYVEQMSFLAPQIAIDFLSEETFFLDDQLDQTLRTLRLHDLVYKLRYSTLSKRLERFPGVEGGSWYEVDAGKFATNSTMTNATGVTSIGYILSKGEKGSSDLVVAGIQLQHNKYRTFLLWPNKKTAKKCAERMLAEKLWFDVEQDEFLNTSAAPCSMRNEFAQYDGVFFYRYRRIESNVSPEDLSRHMYKHVEYVKKNEDKFLKIIKDMAD